MGVIANSIVRRKEEAIAEGREPMLIVLDKAAFKMFKEEIKDEFNYDVSTWWPIRYQNLMIIECPLGHAECLRVEP